MRIKCGSTRLVLLTGDTAIKLGLFRPFRFLCRMCLFPFSRKRREHFFGKYGNRFARAALRDMCAGLYANRGEYEYSRVHNDPRVMPTVYSLLRGWIVIQPRGGPVSKEQLRSWRVPEQYRERANEMGQPGQFASLPDGRIVLIDYGRPETRRALLATNREAWRHSCG